MHPPVTSRLKVMLIAGAAVLGMAATPQIADASPYAYASNTITDLTVTYRNGSQLTGISNTFTAVSASAQYTGFPSAVSPEASGTVGNPLSISQVYSGPGPAPAEQAAPSPQMQGTIAGARADAGISGGNANTGVNVFNVAEGYGEGAPGTSGQSTANNQASVTFTVIGTGQRVQVSFTNLIQLIASTANAVGETANARIANTFAVFDAEGNEIFRRSPADINRQVGSGNGVPPTASISGSFDITLLTPILLAGESYTLSLTSSATESVRVGRSTVVPEPASLLLLGAGLLGLAAVRRRTA